MFGNIRRSLIITHTALFIALIAVFSWVSIPFFPVPLTLQTLGVLLAGTIMRRYAVIPVTLYVILGSLGLPVFHNGAAGIGILLGPTGGFLIGFIPAVLTLGLCYEHNSVSLKASGFVIATLIIYLFGISWMTISTGMTLYSAILIGMLPFLVGDAIKAFAAYLIAKRVEKNQRDYVW